MIIAANFQKGPNLHTKLLHGVQILYPNGNSEGSCTADGRCELSARERREHVARVLPDETKYTTLRKVRDDSHRVKNLFSFL